MLGPHEIDAKHRAASLLALDGESKAERVAERATDGEPQPSAGKLVRRIGRPLLERVKDRLEMIARDADAGVEHLESERLVRDGSGCR